jgi:hypothetical protein
MDSLRSKNQFDYNSDDFKFPYEMKYYGTKKVVFFNYSPETFRRKKAGDSGLYYIQGGNIPSDMQTSDVYKVRPSGDSYVTLVCSLNKGTASRVRKAASLNLSPNEIPLFPTLCDSEPYKPVPIHWEIGQNYKPNFAYLPMYQHSCSDHPRSSGFAHEDNYDCLKSMKDAGTPKGVCCDQVVGCIHRAVICTKSLENPYGPDSGKYAFGCGGQAGGNSNGSEWGNAPKHSFFSEAFYCRDKAASGRPECPSTTSCDAGISFGASLGNYVNPCGNPKFVALEGTCPCDTSGATTNGVTWYPRDAGTTRTFHISGNTDCGCGGARIGGAVYINGYTDCTYCVQACDGTGCPPPVWETDPITKIKVLVPATKKKVECTQNFSLGENAKFCACNFTFPWTPNSVGEPRFITSFQYPTFQFTNFAGIAPGGGGLTSVACDSTYYTDCGDIS